MSILAEHSCPACHRLFKTVGGRNAHLRQSTKCAWYRAGKLTDPTLGQWDDMEVEDVRSYVHDSRNLFELIPPPADDDILQTDVEVGEAGPGPSTQANRIPQARVLDDDEDEYDIEEWLEAGARIRVDEKLHDLWRQRFEAQVEEETEEADALYYPFASKLDWRIAHWVVQENIGHNTLNRLLAIPEVRHRQVTPSAILTSLTGP